MWMVDREDLLPFLVARRAATDPDGVFLQRAEDGAMLTWSAAHDAAQAWAGGLRELGVGTRDTVLTMLPNGFEAAHAWLGLMWLVAWEVPINTGYRGRMLDYTIDNSQATIAVVAERYLERLAELDHPVGRLSRVIVPDATGELPDLPYEVVLLNEFLAGAHDG